MQVYIRENKCHSSRVTRGLGTNEHLGSDDVNDAVHEESRRSGELFLGETCDVGSYHRHDDSVVDTRAGDDDDRTEATTLILLLIRCDVKQDNPDECNGGGNGSQGLLLGSEPRDEGWQRRYDKLGDTLNCEVRGSKKLSCEIRVAEAADDDAEEVCRDVSDGLGEEHLHDDHPDAVVGDGLTKLCNESVSGE